MLKKYFYVPLFISLVIMLVNQSVIADGGSRIISFDDEEVEVRVNGDFDYWPADKLGTPPIDILDKDDSNFVKIKAASGEVWVSLSYVTTDEQAAMKKNCQSQQLAQSGSKKQFGVRGIGESCE